MAESLIAKNRRDGTLQVINGTRTYTVAMEQGDFAVSGANEGNYETTEIEDRGEYSHERRTKRKYPTFTFTAWMRDLIDGTDTTLVGMLLKLGVHSTDASIVSGSEVYMVNLKWTVDGTTHGDAANHTATYATCRITDVNFAEAEDKNTVSISGVCRGTITYT